MLVLPDACGVNRRLRVCLGAGLKLRIWDVWWLNLVPPAVRVQFNVPSIFNATVQRPNGSTVPISSFQQLRRRVLGAVRGWQAYLLRLTQLFRPNMSDVTNPREHITMWYVSSLAQAALCAPSPQDPPLISYTYIYLPNLIPPHHWEVKTCSHPPCVEYSPPPRLVVLKQPPTETCPFPTAYSTRMLP